MCLDGPTFVATEGWDWIPAVRDRDTGIWQPVTLTATSAVKIGDAASRNLASLARHYKRAEVEITVPLENVSTAPVTGTLKASFGEIVVTKQLTLAPGKSSVKVVAGGIRATHRAASAPVVAERLRQARPLHPASQLSPRERLSPTQKTCASEFARSPTNSACSTAPAIFAAWNIHRPRPA